MLIIRYVIMAFAKSFAIAVILSVFVRLSATQQGQYQCKNYRLNTTNQCDCYNTLMQLECSSPNSPVKTTLRTDIMKPGESVLIGDPADYLNCTLTIYTSPTTSYSCIDYSKPAFTQILVAPDSSCWIFYYNIENCNATYAHWVGLPESCPAEIIGTGP